MLDILEPQISYALQSRCAPTAPYLLHQDIATRVAVLEQKSAEARSPGQDQDEHAAGEGNDLFGFASPEQISPRSSHSGAEDANLRAKNDVLKRKVDIMREQLEETKLELSTARNVLQPCALDMNVA